MIALASEGRNEANAAEIVSKFGRVSVRSSGPIQSLELSEKGSITTPTVPL
jgi:hypothetical protein